MIEDNWTVMQRQKLQDYQAELAAGRCSQMRAGHLARMIQWTKESIAEHLAWRAENEAVIVELDHYRRDPVRPADPPDGDDLPVRFYRVGTKACQAEDWSQVCELITNIIGFHALAEDHQLKKTPRRLEYEAKVYGFGVSLAHLLVRLSSGGDEV